MTKTKYIILPLAALTLAVATPAFADSTSARTETTIKRGADGDYNKSEVTEATDAQGTLKKQQIDTKVNVNRDGSRETTVKTQDVNDPKGLMNKNEVDTEHSTKVNSDGSTDSTFKKRVNGDTVESTHDQNPPR